jgi:hypothetical protein
MQMVYKFSKNLTNKKPLSYFLLAMGWEIGRGPAGLASPTPRAQPSVAQPLAHST